MTSQVEVQSSNLSEDVHLSNPFDLGSNPATVNTEVKVCVVSNSIHGTDIVNTDGDSIFEDDINQMMNTDGDSIHEASKLDPKFDTPTETPLLEHNLEPDDGFWVVIKKRNKGKSILPQQTICSLPSSINRRNVIKQACPNLFL